MSWISPRKALVTSASALLLTFTVAGCGAAEDELAEKITEEAVEAAGDGTEVDIEEDGVTVTDENGDQASIGTEMPDDFPVDDVPLVEGTVVSASSVDGASFTLMLEVEGDPETAHEEAVTLLTDAGYTSGTEMNSEGYYAATLSKEGFEVGVTTMAGDPATQISYIVTVS
jgi:hypothetical protein